MRYLPLLLLASLFCIPLSLQCQEVLPNAHAHNDYEHERPLLDALDHGFMSVEVDVWLIEGKFLVKHNRPNNIAATPTLSALYLSPLSERIKKNEGRVYPEYEGPFYLMIDLKNAEKGLYQQLNWELARFPELIDNPHLVIFLSGNRPIQEALDDSSRVLGIDGRPADIGKGYSAEFMPVISQRYSKVLNWKGKKEIKEEERAHLYSLVKQAHNEGRKVRLWASPEDERVWDLLLKAGVDFINTDELGRLREYLFSRKAETEEASPE